MKLSYSWERFSDIIPELPRLFLLHYDEVVKDKELMKMDFKWGRHIDLEKMGLLKVLAVRSDKILVGYVLWLVNENLNFLMTNAITSLYFLDPLYRQADDGIFGGRQMFLESEPGLVKMGVDAAFITSPSGATTVAFDRMMKVIGYKAFQNVYIKDLKIHEGGP